MMLCTLMLQRNLLPQSMFRRAVNFYQTTRRHMPEDCYLHSYTCKNLVTFKAMKLYFHKTFAAEQPIKGLCREPFKLLNDHKEVTNSVSHFGGTLFTLIIYTKGVGILWDI